MVKSAATIGILLTARKWPNTVEPAMSTRTMQAVFRDSPIDLIKFGQLISLLARDKRRTARVPILPASVGVKKPHTRPKTTMIKIRTTQASSGRDLIRSFQGKDS